MTRFVASFGAGFGALAVAAGVALAAPPAARQAALDAEFRAAYPMSAPAATTQLSGVRLAKLGIPGLQLSERSEQAADEGGLLLSYADRTGTVRVLIRIAVAADAAAARKLLETELRGVSMQLARASDPTLGDFAWADDGGRGGSLLVAALGNVSYSVNVVDATPELPSAASLAAMVRAAMVTGTPAFPAVTLRLPATIDAKSGGAVSIAVPGGAPYKLRADGAYIARGPSGPLVRPFGPGAIAVHATVVDELGRVGIATARSQALAGPP